MSNGITTSALFYGGDTLTAKVANAESWNGSAWTEVGDLNQARASGANAGNSGNTVGLLSGGRDPSAAVALNESWNGSSFTEVNDVSTARFTGAPAHNSSSIDALLAGGNPGNSNATEEWTADNALSTVTLS